jgi:hypothetical protein
VIRKVTRVIAARCHTEVQFPTSPVDRATVMHGFHGLAAFPGVLGAIGRLFLFHKSKLVIIYFIDGTLSLI